MITLASDFGSPYPAAMKGVLCRMTDAQLIDVTHDLPRHDTRAAAFWLRFVLPEFPPAVHLIVVDPGVGTDRSALAVRAGDHVLVGPDNGVLCPPARALARNDRGTDEDDRDIEWFEIHAEQPESSTFHGRDVFAPAAAVIHEAGTGPADGINELNQLEPTTDVIDLRLPEPTTESGWINGEVLVVDEFGNAITNVSGETIEEVLGDPFDEPETVRVNDEPTPFVRTFADVPVGESLVTVGSHGYVELDVNQGRGDDAFGIEPGDSVRFER